MSDDKSEDPTEHKLRQAREEGQVVKSQDVVTAVSAVAVVGVLVATAGDAHERLKRIVTLGLDTAGADLDLTEMMRRMGTMASEAGWLLGPLVAASAIAGVVGVAMQVGLQITPKVVALKLDAVDPSQGIKKVFSLKSLMSLAQSLLRAVVLGIVLWQAVLMLMPLISAAVFQSPQATGVIAWSAIETVLRQVLLVLVVLAPVDYLIQRHAFMKQQRMSKDEVKREYKGQEGDPLIKGQRRQLAMELAEEAPVAQVAHADALIVNPTHYAVAVRYRADEAGVPVVLCKGLDDQALALRAEAERLSVPVFANPPLARALHKVPVNGAVPDELFEAVAAILRWVRDLGPAEGQPPSEGHGEPS